MKLPSRVLRLSRSLGLGVPLSREAMALARFKLETSVRLAKSPARVAIVGCGVQGQTIGRSIRKLEGWSITALHDLSPEASRRFKATLASEAEIFPTLDDLLARPDWWDVLAIATTSDSHVAVAASALCAGAQKILLEKPVASSLADADALIQAAEPKNAGIAVDHTRRWFPSGPGLRRLIASGAIGEPCSLHFTFGRAGFAMIGSHLFDFARYLLDAEIVRLRADLDADTEPSRRGAQFVDHSGRCQAELSNGVRLTVDLSRNLQLRQAYFVLFGERGRIEVDERLGRLRLVGSGGRVWEDGYVGLNALELGVATALYELHTGRPPRCGLRDGRAALEATIACHLSAREGGRWVPLPLAGDICHERFPFA